MLEITKAITNIRPTTDKAQEGIKIGSNHHRQLLLVHHSIHHAYTLEIVRSVVLQGTVRAAVLSSNSSLPSTPLPSKQMPWQPRAHLAAAPYNAANWVMDSGATHHLTSDLNNLALHHPYNGGEEVTIADGSALTILHMGSSLLSTSSRPLKLQDVLCVPDFKQNLISVYRMCNNNQVSVEFFPTSFQVKDLSTGVRLLQGRTRNELYE